MFAPKIFKVNQKRKALCEKCPNTELLARIFLHSDWIWKATPYLSVFSLNKGKYGPEKSLYMGTFHAVKPILRVKCCRWSWIFKKRHLVEAVTQRSSAKQFLLNIWQNLQEITCIRVFLKYIYAGNALKLYFKKDSCIGVSLCIFKNSLELVASDLGKQLETLTINYDLDKYLRNVTIIIDFVENWFWCSYEELWKSYSKHDIV